MTLLLLGIWGCDSVFPDTVDDYNLTHDDSIPGGFAYHVTTNLRPPDTDFSSSGYTFRFKACLVEDANCSGIEAVSCNMPTASGNYKLDCGVPQTWIDQNKTFRLTLQVQSPRDNQIWINGVRSPSLSATVLGSRWILNPTWPWFGLIGDASSPPADDRCAGVTCSITGQTCNHDNGACECSGIQRLSSDRTTCEDIPPAQACNGPCGTGQRCDLISNMCVAENVSGGACGSNDLDCDTVPDDHDNCPGTANADQLDSDMDGLGDACDKCPNISKDERLDRQPGQSDTTGFWLAPAAGCPAGLMPTTAANLSQATTGGSGGSSTSCALVKNRQGSFQSFVLLMILSGALFFTRRRTASRN